MVAAQIALSALDLAHNHQPEQRKAEGRGEKYEAIDGDVTWVVQPVAQKMRGERDERHPEQKVIVGPQQAA